MKLVGFNFNKINIEKMKNDLKDLKINTSINLKEIKEIKADLIKSKDILLSVSFNYSINYDPKIAEINFEGFMIIEVDSKLGKDILKDWKKKIIKEEIRISFFNAVLMKSNIKALELEENMNLPSHFQMPSLRENEKGN